jgi:hypothetical protein
LVLATVQEKVKCCFIKKTIGFHKQKYKKSMGIEQLNQPSIILLKVEFIKACRVILKE